MKIYLSWLIFSFGRFDATIKINFLSESGGRNCSVPSPGSWSFPGWSVPACWVCLFPLSPPPPPPPSCYLLPRPPFFPPPFPFTLTILPSSPPLISPLPWFLARFCFLFVFLRAVLQLPHIWREEAAANPVSICF